jgi:hypothetical protein
LSVFAYFSKVRSLFGFWLSIKFLNWKRE